MIETLSVEQSVLSGSLQIPASKSHTLRALLWASLSPGRSEIAHALESPDTEAMLRACTMMGSRIETDQQPWIIQGCSPALAPVASGSSSPHAEAPRRLYVGNSGQVLRWISALAVLNPNPLCIDGDQSIRSQRSMQDLLDALAQAGARIVYTGQRGYAPFSIQGPLRPVNKAFYFSLTGRDSQPVSALLTLACFLPYPSHILVSDPGEQAWVDLTLSWFRFLGLSYEKKRIDAHPAALLYSVSGAQRPLPFTYRVPGDWSSAAFPIVAALLTQSTLSLSALDLDDAQGDKEILSLLQSIGARYEMDSSTQTLTILPSPVLSGFSCDMNRMIDALPILATLACFCDSPSYLYNAGIARCKESDRLRTITEELRKMGAQIEEEAEALSIRPAVLTGATVYSHHDHRIALSLCIAGLVVGQTTVLSCACIAKSYPDFISSFQSIGAQIYGQ